MKVVKAYLANQLGFSETGKLVLDNYVIPRLERIGLVVNNPFVECAKELDLEHVNSLEKYDDRMNYWNDFNKKITPINNGLMRDSDCLLAILDGGHTVDDGVSSEIGYYAGIKKGPIFALRSDIRLSENIACLINPQISGYVSQSGGKLVVGPNALNNWFKEIKKWYDSFIK